MEDISEKIRNKVVQSEVEEQRAKWKKTYKKKGWAETEVKVIVYVNRRGIIQDSISFPELQEDKILLLKPKEE